MNVIEVAAFGEADQLVLTETSAPTPSPGQVVVAVEASGVGLVDVLIRRGLYPGMQPGLVLGAEVAGTVTALGAGVDVTWLGQRVYALLRTGGYAEQVAVAATSLVPLPAALTALEAVGLGLNALVAHFALEQGRVLPGESVIVRGAGGGIGVMATQLALLRMARVTAVTSSEQRQQQLLALGATAALTREAAASSPEEFACVLDAVAGPELPAYLGKLAANGRYVVVGAAGGMPPADFGSGLLQQFSKSLSLSFASLDSVSPDHLRAAATTLFDLAVQGKLRPVIDQVYPLARAADAHRHLEEGGVFGKLVLIGRSAVAC